MADLKELNIPEKKRKQFEKKGINSVSDLLYFFPRKYCDFQNPVSITNAVDKQKCMTILFVQKVEYVNSRFPFIKATCMDTQSQATVIVLWFNQAYLLDKLTSLQCEKVACAGTISLINQYNTPEFINPLFFSEDISEVSKIMPVYSKIPGMSNDFLHETIDQALSAYEPEEPLPENIRTEFGLISEKQMIRNFHFPESSTDLVNAKRKMIIDFIYEYAVKLCSDANSLQKKSSFIPVFLSETNNLIKSLPYSLTTDQQLVVKNFVTKAQKGERVNALIQGDVGCGKTVCAFLLMFAMADNGFQSALMAPTSVLAKQHYEELASYAEKVGYKAVYLGGDLKAAEKKKVLKQIECGEANFVVGTHALVSKSVCFKNLGLTVVDEEHKFGVVQRESLKIKAATGVHSVSMSATPIPRSLALAVYGDALDIYNITSMPNGRKPILTQVVNNKNSSYRFMLSQIHKGHQCYIVCPLISPGEKSEMKEDGKELPTTVEDEEKSAHAFFDRYGIRIGVITGKMNDDQKNTILDQFKRNEIQILIATTIIEVGVNVPNATVICIENAESFGLAGLHQLRGRVGRSDLQSYCILRSNENKNPRLSIMCQTTDGFEIAEEDLKLRGTGELTGTKQSGSDEKLVYVLKYPKIYEKVKSLIINLERGESHVRED